MGLSRWFILSIQVQKKLSISSKENKRTIRHDWFTIQKLVFESMNRIDSLDIHSKTFGGNPIIIIVLEKAKLVLS